MGRASRRAFGSRCGGRGIGPFLQCSCLFAQHPQAVWQHVFGHGDVCAGRPDEVSQGGTEGMRDVLRSWTYSGDDALPCRLTRSISYTGRTFQSGWTSPVRMKTFAHAFAISPRSTLVPSHIAPRCTGLSKSPRCVAVTHFISST